MNRYYSQIGAGLLFLAMAALSFGCAKQELTVAYLYVPAFDVQRAPASGDISSRITDVRVVLGAESLGFYPLPARIPILASGSQRIRLEPTVRVAGIAGNRIVYPFYEVFEETLNLVAGTIDTIRPIINYVPSATFAYVEDFETTTPALPLDLDANPDSKFVVSADNPSHGSGSGIASLNSLSRVLEVATPVFNSSGQTWSNVWLELDYRGEIPLAVAVLPETPGEEAVRVTRYSQGASDREDWRKFYFELVNGGQSQFATEPFRVGFFSVLDTTTVTSADIHIDNIKVIYQN